MSSARWARSALAVAFGGAVLTLGSSPRAEGVVPAAPPNLTASLGKPITRVDVVLEDATWEVETPRIKGIKPNTPLTEGTARRAMAEIESSGRFASARVDVVDDGASVHLVVHAVPRKLVRSVRVELNGAPLERDDLLREAGLAEGAEITGTGIGDQQDHLKAVLAKSGFPNGRVTFTTRTTEDDLEMDIVLEVSAGAPRLVNHRYFYIYGTNPNATTALTDAYAVRAGDRADDSALEAADTKLALSFRSHGYHRATVSHDLVSLGANVTGLRVRVDAGPQFLPRFEGNDHYDADALGAALGLEDDGDRSGSKLVEKLIDFYQKRGFLDAEVKLETRGDDKDPSRRLMFHIRENSRVRVVSRAYPCLREADIEKLTEGGPTSASEVGSEIDSYLEEDLPGADLVQSPDPQGLDRTMGGAVSRGEHPSPIDLAPNDTFFGDSYERAIEHLRELYRNEGFLHAEVGPLQILRRRCSPRSPAGECTPLPLPPMPKEVCAYDAGGLPLPIAKLDPSFTCKPDPTRGVSCEAQLSLRIPVKLGPRTSLYDVTFLGVRSLPERKLLQDAKLVLGQPIGTLKIEEASRRILDTYREEGYAFAEVRNSIEPSPDHTRARVRFEVIEGEQVLVRDIVILGNAVTRAKVISQRVALEVGKPYRASDVRKTQERIATLGTFESVDVSLEEPYLPQKRKLVVIRVVERPRQYLEIRPGVSSGEGARLTAEYGHRNIDGRAIGVSTRIQLAVLPDFLIFDDTVRANFKELDVSQRFTVRLTSTATFPDVGLGPLVRANIDAIVAQDLQRGYLLQKGALIPGITFRPAKDVQLSFSQSAEYNNVKLLGSAADIAQFDQQLNSDPTLARLLRVPRGKSVAFAQKATIAWDRRDNAFSAHRGTYLVASAEHVDSFSIPDSVAEPRNDGHFFRLTQTFSGYVPLPRKLVLAATLRVGQNVHIFPRARSQTYPDRLFFLGGSDSVRGFQLDQLVPQDVADGLPNTKNPGIRGGDVMINPRVELRIPVWSSFETVAFFDAGNVWVDPFSIKSAYDLFKLRTTAGTGIRWNSPVGVPFVLDVGFNLLPRPYERQPDELLRYEVQFAMGLF